MRNIHDWYEKRRQKQMSAIMSDNVLSKQGKGYDYLHKNDAGYTSLSKRFNNLYKKALDYYNNDAFKSFSDTYSGTRKNDGSYAANTGRWYSDLEKQSKKANEGIDELLAELDQYSSYYNEDAVKYVRGLITERQNAYNDAMKDAGEFRDTMSQWKTEDDYNYAISKNDAVKAYESGDYDAAEQILKGCADKLVSKYGDDHYGLINSEEYKELLGFEEAIASAKQYKADEEAYEAQRAEYAAYDVDAGQAEIDGIKNRISELEGDHSFWDKLSVAATELGMDIFRNDEAMARDKELEELNKLLVEKEKYHDEVTKWKNLTLLQEGATKDPDFESYAEQGMKIENPSATQFFGVKEDDIGNIVTYSRENADLIRGNMAEYADVAGDSKYAQMTDDEVKIYSYYLAKYGKDKAQEYLNAIDADLIQRETDYLNGVNYELAQDHPFLSSAASVITSLGSGVEYAGDALKYLVDGTIDPYRAEMDKNSLAETTNTIRGAVTDKVDWQLGEWDAFDFLYNTGMSGADSLAASVIPGGGVILGLSAAAQGTNDALERGLSSEQAFWNGAVQGAFEGIFESVSIGKFKSLQEAVTAGGKDVCLNIAKSMLVNASEEACTEVANILYDTIVNGEFSNYEAIVQQYMTENGMTREAAESKAKQDLFYQILESAGSGALMGAGFGGIGSAVSHKATKNEGAKFTSDPGTLIDEALRLDPNDKYALSLKAKLESGKKVSQAELGKLSFDNTEKVSEAFKESDKGIRAREQSAREQVENKIEKKLSSRVENKSLRSSLAQSVTKAILGENVSNAELRQISKNEAALRVLNKEFGADFDVKSGVSVSELRNAISSRQGSSVKLSSENILATVAALSNMDEATERGLYTSYATDVRNGKATPPEDFARAYTAVWAAGKKGVAVSEIDARISSVLSESALATAYKAGERAAKAQGTENSPGVLQNGAESGTINTNGKEAQNEQGLHLRQGGERYDGTNTSGQVSAVEGRAGEAEEQGSGSNQEARTARIGAYVQVEGLEKVSTRSIGVSSGTDKASVVVIPESEYDDGMRQIIKDQAEQGRNVVFVSGSLEIIENGEAVEARGLISEDGKTMWIQADSDVSAEQISLHEEYHAKVKSDPSLLNRMKKKIKKKYKGKLGVLTKMYAALYFTDGNGKVTVSADYIFEEICADAYAGIDVLESFDAAEIRATDFQETIREGAKEIESTRAPPSSSEVKASRATQDIYTATSDFARDVIKEDRSAFTSHLLSQTRGMKPSDVKGIQIFGAKRIYFFLATGEMTGKVYKSVSNKRLNLYKKICEEFFNGIEQSGEGPALWAEFDSLKEGGDISDTSLSGYGRTTDGNDTISEKSSQSNSARSDERSGGYTYSAREIDAILKPLKEMYGVDDSGIKASRTSKSAEEIAKAYLDAVPKRMILANALESVVSSEEDKKKLRLYKYKIKELDAMETELSEVNANIRELSFATGPRDKVTLAELKKRKTELESRISRYDSSLIRLEASEPIQKVLRLTKKQAVAKVKAEAKVKLDAQRERAKEALDKQAKRYQESKKKSAEEIAKAYLDAVPDVQQAKGGSSEWSAERIEGGKAEKARPVSEIIEQIRHDFGINITKGHVRGKGVLGQYSRRNHGIRTKIANDLPTVAHELGHALDQRYGLTDNSKLTKEMRSELVNALGDLKGSYKQNLWVSEGLAEYMRRFLQNRDDAARTYPEFTRHFLSSLSKADRVLIDTFADEINAYYALDGDTATSSIRLREEGVPDARTPLEKARDMGDGVYQAWVDANHGIRLFDEATGANTYKLASNAAYSDAIAGQIITGDLTDANGQYVAPGLKAALEGVNIGDKKIYREFGEYLVLRHGPERLGEGMRIFADERKNNAAFMEKRAGELEVEHPEFKEAADRLYTFQKQFLQTWAVDTGLLPSEVAEEWAKRWSFYVPLNRAVGKAGTVGAKRGYANQNSTVRKAIGSGLDIVHPVDNIINNIVKMVNAGVRNNVMLEITAQAKAVGADATFLEEVPTPMKKKTADLTGVKAKLHDAFGAAGIGELLAEVEGEIAKRNKPESSDVEMAKAYGIEITGKQLEDNAREVVSMSNVSSLTGTEFESDGKTSLKEKVISFFNNLGNKVQTKEIGEVALTKTSFSDDKGHGLTRNKIVSFSAIPEVLRNGRVIDVYKPDGKPYIRITIAAPIEIAGEKYYMGVMVQKDNQSNRMYLHDVITEKATLSLSNGANHQNSEGIRDEGHLFITSILQKRLSVNYFSKKNIGNGVNGKSDAWSKVDEIIESAIDDVLIQYGQGKAHGDVVTVLREGKQEFWKINDALLLESLTNLSQKKMNGIMEAYAVVSRFMTSNITGNNIIWSIFSNFPRDMMTFFTYSKQKNPLKAFPTMGEAYLNKVTGGNAETKNLPYIKEYYALGGGQTSAYTADVDLAKRARKKLKHSTKLQSAAYYANPLNVLSFVSETVESGPRIATYIMMRGKGMSPQEAFYESQDITVNFKRGGRLSREFNKAVPFFNASVQGLDKFKRWITCADVPKAQRAKAIAGRVTMYVAVSAALGALIYALNNGDDEDEENYRLLSNYTKNTYWNIPLGDGKYFAIPKPREIAVLSTFIETSCEYFGGNDYAYDEFGDYVADNFLPPFLSDFVTDGMDGALGSLGIIGVASDLKANKDFLGRPIESTSLSGYESQDRYTRRTSQIAYWLGQAAAELGLDWSPVQIDYFFSQVLGGYWKVQKALFPVGSENVDWTLGVQNTYVKDNQYSNDIVNWMYDKATSSAQAAKSHPEDTDIAIEAKLDGDMKSFYSRYYALTKGQKEDAAARRAKRVVLDMIVEYRKASDNGDESEAQKVIYDLIDRCHDTSLLPSVMQTKVKDADGNEHSLRDYQYVEYQTTYNALYWGYVEDNLGGNETDVEMIAIIKKAQTIAKERATQKALESVGAGSSGYFEKYPGIDDSDLITFQSQMDIETDKDGGLSQEELIDILEKMVADGLSREDAYTLFKSRYPTSDKNNPWRSYAP